MLLQHAQLLLLMFGLHVVLFDPLQCEVVLVIQQLLCQQLVGGIFSLGQPLTAVDLEEEVDSSVPIVIYSHSR